MRQTSAAHTLKLTLIIFINENKQKPLIMKAANHQRTLMACKKAKLEHPIEIGALGFRVILYRFAQALVLSRSPTH